MAGGGSTHKELLTAQTRLWNYALGYIRPLSLAVAVQLGIPEAVQGHGGPISLSDLASAVGVAEASKVLALRRFMRALSHFGCFERSVTKAAAGEGQGECEEEEEAYAPTLFSSSMVKDSPTTAAPFLLLATCPLLLSVPWNSLAAWFRGERSESAYGIEAPQGGTFWELLSRVPELNGLFNDAMACDARWAVALLAKAHPEVFHGLTSLVDVGGGNGTSAKAIKDAFPDLRCAVLELGHVIAASPAVEGVDFVEGDMFEHVPPADAVLLKWVLHDWNDEDGVRILRRCREAVTPATESGGKVIIIDIVMSDGSGGGDPEEVEAQHLFDMWMLAIMAGAERTEKEWRRIITAAGFSSCKIIPGLGPRSIIEAYP
ncbi:hypothetical protein Taro_048143 [Colocasia esculenta]|uniref:Uncharacterized protein n=1 Tax=Colocasia esculenta TaxID=4460 RepID=A0A843X783_COLES|nr:hypothetical protein [Colocasia esculenta]